MSYPLQYVRTDRNGTKYYHDWTCPRCGGAGESDKWLMTGRICYGCGGTGKRSKPRIVKEYTEEHQAELDARRIARQAKNPAPVVSEDEMRKELQECIERRYAEFGCGKDGIGYVLTGKTFPVKDEIKANGGKWVYGVWVCPVDMSGKGIQSKAINLSGHIGGASQMWLDEFDLYEVIHG